MKSIIIDDEPKAIELLENYASKFSWIEIVAVFRNPLKAIEYVNKNKIELIFLDVNMPSLSGISLTKLLPKSADIIFTTAHSEYAVVSYEIGAVDYLLKPISFERFTIAVNKVLNKIVPNEKNMPINRESETESIFLKSGTKLFQLNPKDILFLEKNGNYMNYYYKGKKLLVRQTIQAAISILPNYFLQVHKSYIVSVNVIDFIDKNQINIGGKQIPLSPQFKDSLFKLLNHK